METAAPAVLRWCITGTRIRLRGSLIPPGSATTEQATVAVAAPQGTRAQDPCYRRRHRQQEIPGKIDKPSEKCRDVSQDKRLNFQVEELEGM